MNRIEFTGILQTDASAAEAVDKMERLVQDVDPEFRCRVAGEAMLGSANKEAYECLFGPIQDVGGSWRLAGRPEIHPDIAHLVRSAGPNRKGCFLA